MGRRRLLQGIISGAIVGGLISLLDRDARDYAKKKLKDTRRVTTNVIKNPTETVQSLTDKVEKLNTKISTESDNVINALEQVKGTLEKITKRIN